ncbi:DNA helicase HerA-like ATPase [Halorubrum alkaliphilum]|uniref:DNA helicase HerA-like ATPase n=1 Tax=Halorubrum alkaliphilum TaxID=261290 RepID=A0A8T4GHS7_9EURY|nr:ATP-binding protein [Halorubrum alkaliphilum]MBP1922971.1 DNA helicase HerA-like ATPase [Halorubrum alkaliphilum]
MSVLGRENNSDADESLTVRLGSFLARDGSDGAAVDLDVDSPHAAVVFGKRGTGKSYTLGVLAEGLADSRGVSPVVVDPMGVFGGLTAAGGRIVEPTVRPGSIPAAVWPDLVGLDPTSGAGSLLWRTVADAVDDGKGRGGKVDGDTAAGGKPSVPASIDSFRRFLSEADAPDSTRRTVRNHLRLAESWGIFDADAPSVSSFAADGTPTVLDLAGVPETASAGVVRAVARGLYDARVDGDVDRLPWLLVDEAHAFFGGVADPALRTLLTRGRSPGVSFVCATQRPGALPSVAVSQSDLLVTHRLTAEPDVERLAEAEATYLAGDLASRLPTGTGEALVVDDATETAHTVRVRRRRTPHEGGSPSASEVTID